MAGAWIEVVSHETAIAVDELKFLAQFGAVYLNDSRIENDEVIAPEDYLRIYTRPRRYPRARAEDLLVFQNEDLIVVDKLSGIPCHPSLDNLHENILSYLEKDLARSILPTHRLDTCTMGLLVFAKTSSAQAQFQKLLVDRKVRKIYFAKVESPGPTPGFYEHYMDKTPYSPKTVWESPRPDRHVCQLKVLSARNADAFTELEIELITGRTHQIRAQLAFLQFPILKDVLYGGKQMKNNKNEIELSCSAIEFSWEGKMITLRRPIWS